MNERVSRALRAHFAKIHERIAAGEPRLGYKVAFNVPAVQRRLGIEGSLLAGLTRASVVPAGEVVEVGHMTRPLLEAEIAVRLADDVSPDATPSDVERAIEGIAPAIELVDLDLPLDRLEEILAGGVFHRAVAFGAFAPAPRGASLRGIKVRVSSADEAVFSGDAEEATGALGTLLPSLARLAASAGERLRAGDQLILGSMAPPHPACPNERFRLCVDGYGDVELGFR